MRRIAVTDKSAEFASVKKLYEDAFPENERQGFSLEHQVEGIDNRCDVFAYYDSNIFIGFASVLWYEDIAHILYFAVEDNLRGKKYGSKIIDDLAANYPGKKIIADIELPDETVENGIERIKRQNFYFRNGFEKCPIRYGWHEEQYIIVSKGGIISEERFKNFWKYFSSYRRIGE